MDPIVRSSSVLSEETFKTPIEISEEIDKMNKTIHRMKDENDDLQREELALKTVLRFVEFWRRYKNRQKGKEKSVYFENLSHHDKLVLRAIRDVLTNTGAPSCSVDEGIYQQYKALSTLESNVAPLSEMNLLLRIRSLRKYGLVKTPGDRLNINTAVSLHIEPEDVHLALMSAEYE